MTATPLSLGPVSTPETVPRSIVLTAAAALAALTLLRLVVAAALPLSPDEAYYWTWSHALAPGYLDHPPMVALWIKAGTALLSPFGGETALGVRLLAPLSAAAGSVLLALAGTWLFSLRTGIWAAALLNATLLMGVGAVTMTPDTPLLFFWTATLLTLARLATRPKTRAKTRLTTGGAATWWLLTGLCAGLALDSKYTAGLLGLGIALWLLTPAMRPHLRTPWPWLGGALAVALTGPVIAWNAAHGWISLLKQGGRTTDWHPTLRYLGELAAGQTGLATPGLALLMVVGAAWSLRRWREPGPALLAALILPGAAVFVQHAIGDRVQANWVAVLYPAAALAAAAATAKSTTGPTTRFHRWRAPSAALGFAVTALLYVQGTLAPLPLPRTLDPTLRLAGFGPLATAVDDAAAENHAAFIASEEYGLAALLAWHAPPRSRLPVPRSRLPVPRSRLPVLGNEPRWRSFDLPAATPAAEGLLILGARRTGGPDPALWQSAIPLAPPLDALERQRNGRVAETYRLYRVTLRPGAPAVIMPLRASPLAQP